MGEATFERLQTRKIVKISIHASRGGSDIALSVTVSGTKKFQSTLPVGEATKALPYDRVAEVISIHASRGGSDLPGRGI